MHFIATHEAGKLLVVGLVLIFGSLSVSGQDGAHLNRASKPDALTIVNPGHINIPGDRARVLLITTCRVVAEEFHRSSEDVEMMMTLVMGARDEHYSIDKEGRMTMYLERWDEGKFVDGVITSVVQRLAPLHLRNQMFTEILRRTDRIAPVSTKQLRAPGSNPPLPRGATSPSCISAVSRTPCPWPNQPQNP